MGDCRVEHPEDPSLCEYTAATWVNSPSICRQASDPNGCLGAVAAESRDPQIILDGIDDPTQQAIVLSSYVAATGDADAIELIEDNYLHDQAVIYSASRLGIGEDRRLPATYCDSLRGGYSGENDGDEASTRDLCRTAVGMNNWAVDQLNAAETEAEQARVAEAIESLSERFASGEISVEDWLAAQPVP
jgi:hypothetical protein